MLDTIFNLTNFYFCYVKLLITPVCKMNTKLGGELRTYLANCIWISILNTQGIFFPAKQTWFSGNPSLNWKGNFVTSKLTETIFNLVCPTVVHKCISRPLMSLTVFLISFLVFRKTILWLDYIGTNGYHN